MNIHCLFITSEYRGDHAADICIIHVVKPGETVEELVQRVGLNLPADRIELKIVKE